MVKASRKPKVRRVTLELKQEDNDLLERLCDKHSFHTNMQAFRHSLKVATILGNKGLIDATAIGLLVTLADLMREIKNNGEVLLIAKKGVEESCAGTRVLFIPF